MSEPRSVLAFIVGAGRSGTTWLWRSLASHPEVLGLPETHVFNFQLTSHPQAERVFQHATWFHVAKAIEQSGGSGELPRSFVESCGGTEGVFFRSVPPAAIRSLHARRQAYRSYEEWGDFAEAIFADLDGLRPVILEKTPRHAVRCSSIKRRFPRARFIGLIRDGRDVLASLRARGKAWSERLREVRDAAEHWMRCNIAILEAQQQWPDSVHLLRYEDLLADYDGQLAELFRFLELEDDVSTIADIRQQNSFEAYTGRKQGDDAPGEFYRRGTAGGFVDDLSWPDVRAYEELAGPLLETLGYRLTGDANAERSPVAASVKRSTQVGPASRKGNPDGGVPG